MSRKNKKRFKAQQTATANNSMEAFTFGDPVPVLDKREIFDYLECAQIDNWYEPPISFDGLSKLFRAATHHSSAIYVKRNILVSTFQPNRFLSKLDFSRFALDFLTFGNAYLERRNNMVGNL
ncbi:capsid portal protein, partial [Proteus mirabilis]|nr:capsid portal protein [Proteus mirabilis]ELS4560879.1 capsid portal protein [Proteus mirabilis]HEK3085127.1 capsid portal protein [Proteus mirabilis]